MAIHIRRREFIVTLGGAAAAAWPVAARAQQPAMPVIGFVNPQSLDGHAGRLRGFRQGLKDAGFVEGENVAIEYRWADGQFDRLPALVPGAARVAVLVNPANATTAETTLREATALARGYRSQALARTCTLTGWRRLPHVPCTASNAPAQGVPQSTQRPSAERFHAVRSYQSRPMRVAPQPWQYVLWPAPSWILPV